MFWNFENTNVARIILISFEVKHYLFNSIHFVNNFIRCRHMIKLGSFSPTNSQYVLYKECMDLEKSVGHTSTTEELRSKQVSHSMYVCLSFKRVFAEKIQEYFPPSSLIVKTHIIFLVVGPLREGGFKSPEPLRKKTFFSFS